MTILEFFNIHDPNHLRAFRVLQKTGGWPIGFIPDDVEFTETMWSCSIQSQMATEYIKMKLDPEGQQ